MYKASYQSFPQRDGCCGHSTAYKACIFQEFSVCFPLHFILTMFDIRVSKCQPPASKQASHLLKIFLDVKLSSCLVILTVPL